MIFYQIYEISNITISKNVKDNWDSRLPFEKWNRIQRTIARLVSNFLKHGKARQLYTKGIPGWFEMSRSWHTQTATLITYPYDLNLVPTFKQFVSIFEYLPTINHRDTIVLVTQLSIFSKQWKSAPSNANATIYH